MRWLRRFAVFALILILSGSASAQFSKYDIKDSRNNPAILHAFHTVVAKPSESTVRVLADGKEVAFGTVVDPDGWILTKWDDVRDRQNIVCKLRDGKELEAKLVGHHVEYDLAILKIDAKGLKPIEWRPSKDAKVGRWVASVGTGTDPVAIGVVSVATRKLVLGDQPPKTINVNSGYLGVGLDAGMGGAKVTQVDPKTPAFAAGLKINDVIYEAAGRRIPDHEALINTIGRLKAGDKVLLKVKRGEEDLELSATLGKRPAKMIGGNPQELMGSKLSNRRGGFPFILQHDTVLRPEDCGGPLVDLDGKAVGINIARAGRTETYAIPSEEIQKILPDLKKGKIGPSAGTDPLKKSPDHVLLVRDNLSPKDPISKLGKGRVMKIYDVKLTKGVTYIIELDSGEIDPYLILEDAKGKKLAEDDDGGGFPNARIVFVAPADGDYRVIATTFNPNETGSYTLSVRKQAEKDKK
jgi:serine protease Do